MYLSINCLGMNKLVLLSLVFICFSCLYETIEIKKPDDPTKSIKCDSTKVDSTRIDFPYREIKYLEGHVVGFDPCTIRHSYKPIGYAIISHDLEDTVMTYNFPDSIFNIPSNYFSNYMSSGYFPNKARYEFKIRMTYRSPYENEVVILLCTADFNQSDFARAKQVITVLATEF